MIMIKCCRLYLYLLWRWWPRILIKRRRILYTLRNVSCEYDWKAISGVRTSLDTLWCGGHSSGEFRADCISCWGESHGCCWGGGRESDGGCWCGGEGESCIDSCCCVGESGAGCSMVILVYWMETRRRIDIY